MSSISKKSWIASFILLFFLLCVNACDKPDNKGKDTKEALKQQVETLWKARVSKDKKLIYSMVDKEYKKNVTEEQFMKKGDYQIMGGFEIMDMKVDEEKKSAQVNVKYKTMQMGYAFEPVIMENWLVEGGEWKVAYSMRKNPLTGKPY